MGGRARQPDGRAFCVSRRLLLVLRGRVCRTALGAGGRSGIWRRVSAMTRREIDPEQIANFVDAIFRHASAGQFVSLRTFEDCGGSKPLNIHAVEVNGAGLKPVTE